MRGIARALLDRLLPSPVGALEQAVPLSALHFSVVTDKAFGGTSSGSMAEGNRVFRGVLGAGTHPFVAIRADLPREHAYIGDFEGLSVTIRAKDTRHRFSINIHPISYIPNDLYQGFIIIPEPNELCTMHIPFSKMLLTGKGQERQEQRKLDTPRISAIGFSLGGPEAPVGPFELEIASLSWIRNVHVPEAS